MSHLHMSMTVLSVVLTGAAVLFYGIFALYGAWIDGKRQSIREKGLHPVTDPSGEVHAREGEERDGDRRD